MRADIFIENTTIASKSLSEGGGQKRLSGD